MNSFTRHFVVTVAALAALVASSLLVPGPALAAGDRSASVSKVEVEALTAKLRKSMPGLIIDSIKPAVIPGLWELVSGGDVARQRYGDGRPGKGMATRHHRRVDRETDTVSMARPSAPGSPRRAAPATDPTSR